MADEMLTLAMTLGNVPEEDRAVLTALCSLASQELAGRLKPEVKAEDCALAFQMAGAWSALAGYASGNGGGVLKVGDLTIQDGMSAEEQAALLRQQAKMVMAPYLRDDGFAFRGVRG